VTNHRSHRQLIHAIGPALRALKALDLPATIVRIGDAVDDGMGAVATDSDHVTGSGSGSSTTERLALRALPDEHGRKRADRALADLVALKRLLASTLDNLHAITAIARRWPVAMPRREAPTASPGNDCGVCGRYTTGAASDRLRTLQAPTADGTPRPVGACDACRKCWCRLVADPATDTDDPATWRQYVEARTNGAKYVSRLESGVA
jgi:hypothetical protein